VDSKVVIERTAGKWLIDAAELHGNRGREAEQLKSFLSRQVDGPVRLAYGQLPTMVPRQFVIIGSTNSRLAYLKDQTGGRRFWPVAIERSDVEALIADRDQLFAEAAAREAAGASIRLSPTLWTAAGEQQERRRAEDPWELILEPLLDGDGITHVEHVAVEAIWDKLKVEANHRDNRHADRVATIVQRFGFAKKVRKRDGEPTLCWVRADAEDEYL
jgi:predicted P-loop ATPase